MLILVLGCSNRSSFVFKAKVSSLGFTRHPDIFHGWVWLLPLFDVSINMISLFTFILVLGIVVDDAIVVGENIHIYLKRGLSGVDAALKEHIK